jgi:hypothetical protein
MLSSSDVPPPLEKTAVSQGYSFVNFYVATEKQNRQELEGVIYPPLSNIQFIFSE